MRASWLLLIVPAAMLVGAMIAVALRPAQEHIDAGEVHRQARHIDDLEIEIAHLRSTRPPEEPEASPQLHGTTPVETTEADHPPAPAASATPPDGPAERPKRTTIPPETGILDVVRLLHTQDARQEDTSLVAQGEIFAGRFARALVGPRVQAEDTTPTAEVEDGTTIVLDEGVYDFSSFSGAHRGRFPKDVTFQGLGMDRTLLVLHEIGATGETRNLAFEDLTLDTRGHYLADVRGDEPISLRFERARVIGFDQQPGGAVLLAARHGAVLAKDSRIEAGFGNAPGTGSLFHVRGPFLVRFEQCVFTGAFESLYEKSEKAAYAFVRCRFEGMLPERRQDLETKDPNIRLEDCLVLYADPEQDEPATRARTDLNPAWQ